MEFGERNYPRSTATVRDSTITAGNEPQWSSRWPCRVRALAGENSLVLPVWDTQGPVYAVNDSVLLRA